MPLYASMKMPSPQQLQITEIETTENMPCHSHESEKMDCATDCQQNCPDLQCLSHASCSLVSNMLILSSSTYNVKVAPLPIASTAIKFFFDIERPPQDIT